MSELVWLRADPPVAVAEFFSSEYPAITDIGTNLATIRDCGYEPVGHFTLPDAAWWKHYYTPLEQRLARLRRTYADDPEVLAVVELDQQEIEIYRRYSDHYGYVFYVMSTA